MHTQLLYMYYFYINLYVHVYFLKKGEQNAIPNYIKLHTN